MGESQTSKAEGAELTTTQIESHPFA